MAVDTAGTRGRPGLPLAVAGGGAGSGRGGCWQAGQGRLFPPLAKGDVAASWLYAAHWLCAAGPLTHPPTSFPPLLLCQIITEYAGRGFRGLGISIAQGDGSADVDGKAKWEMVALVPLFDPPRHDTKETVERCHDLGIQVKMITGDQLVRGPRGQGWGGEQGGGGQAGGEE